MIPIARRRHRDPFAAGRGRDRDTPPPHYCRAGSPQIVGTAEGCVLSPKIPRTPHLFQIEAGATPLAEMKPVARLAVPRRKAVRALRLAFAIIAHVKTLSCVFLPQNTHLSRANLWRVLKRHSLAGRGKSRDCAEKGTSPCLI